MNTRIFRNSLSAGGLLILSAVFPAFASSKPQALEGVGHFFQVNDKLLRGAQPNEEGFHNLAKMGVKTVIDLREESDRSEWEEKIVKAAGMKYIAVPIAGLAAPTTDQMRKMLQVINDPAAGPVFVHCKRGKDRTGAVVACYRIQHDHWDNAKALKEARNLGMSWFEFPKQQFVLQFRPDGESSPAPAVVPGMLTPAAAN